VRAVESCDEWLPRLARNKRPHRVDPRPGRVNDEPDSQRAFAVGTPRSHALDAVRLNEKTVHRGVVADCRSCIFGLKRHLQ